MDKEKTITVGFEMSLWGRIKLASILWWDIIVHGELLCADDRTEDEKLADAELEKRNI